MPEQIRLPEIAESVVEGEILEWHVAEGEHVDEDQPLLEVSSDKVTVEIPSPRAGKLIRHLVKVGDTVAVNAPIATIGADGEQASSGGEAADQESTGDSEEDPGEALSLFKAGTGDEPTVKNPFRKDRTPAGAAQGDTDGPRAASNSHGRVLAVPSARIMARELELDIESVPGSGPNGRIRVADVRAFAGGASAEEREEDSDRTSMQPAPTLPPPPRYATPAGYEDRESRQPLRGVRRAIAAQMSASHLYAVRTLTVDEADMSRLVALRTRMKPRAEARDVRLSYLPFVFKAIVAGLRAFPVLNTSLDAETNEIVHKTYYNLGLAVATDAGLVVPVVRDVDHKSLLQIAGEINDLAERAREGRLEAAEMRGSSFSVTNIGPIGALMSFPIINVPDAAILGVHSIHKRPVVDADDQIVVRPMMYLSLSFDHRLVDGAEAARFARHVIDLLEDPDALMLEAL